MLSKIISYFCIVIALIANGIVVYSGGGNTHAMLTNYISYSGPYIIVLISTFIYFYGVNKNDWFWAALMIAGLWINLLSAAMSHGYNLNNLSPGSFIMFVLTAVLYLTSCILLVLAIIKCKYRKSNNG